MLNHLLIHNILYVLSAVMVLALGVFIFVRDWKKPAHILYLVMSAAYTIFISGWLLALNATDPIRSQHYLLLTLVNLPFVCFAMHLSFITFGKAKEQRVGLCCSYLAAAALLVFFLTDINRFVLPSAPYLYFPNFYVIGPYYWAFVAFFAIVVIYFFTVLFFEYRKVDPVVKNRMKYFLVAFGWGFGLGSLPFLTVFGIHFDPIYASAVCLYSIPLTYGLLRYDLMDLHLAAKNALLYAGSTAFFGLLIVGVNVLNNYLVTTYENFPFFIIPLFSGFLVMLIGFFVWGQIREVDLLKYEFINNVSHKFRTPLTHIRWLAEELRSENDQAAKNRAVEQIQYASMRLFELTNIVIDIARDDDNAYLYRFNKIRLQDIVTEMYKNHDDQISRKKLIVTLDIAPDVPEISADKTRMQFAIQILFENALIYTPEGGTVTATMRKVGNEVTVSFKDSGIGIDPVEIPHLFTKFYRAANARHTDTEGMGIGLFMAKNIVEKHRGRIWVESEGEGRGSTFSFALPIAH